jgi:hypothetical protein
LLWVSLLLLLLLLLLAPANSISLLLIKMQLCSAPTSPYGRRMQQCMQVSTHQVLQAAVAAAVLGSVWGLGMGAAGVLPTPQHTDHRAIV